MKYKTSLSLVGTLSEESSFLKSLLSSKIPNLNAKINEKITYATKAIVRRDMNSMPGTGNVCSKGMALNDSTFLRLGSIFGMREKEGSNDSIEKSVR